MKNMPKRIGLLVLTLVAFIVFNILGTAVGFIFPAILKAAGCVGPVFESAQFYMTFIGIWIVTLIGLRVIKSYRPILKALGTTASGNNVKMGLLGLLVGFGMNAVCILFAVLMGNITLSFETFSPFAFVFLLLVIFAQSSAEELLDRGFLYQQMQRLFKNPIATFIVTALMFSSMHIFNPGIGVIPLVNIFLIGIMYAMVVYYFDSFWFVCTAHAGWNFTQAILFGLPNSGDVAPYCIFRMDTSTATDGFFYNVAFGVEGALFTTVLVLVCIGIVYFLGKKRKTRGIDVWKGTPYEDVITKPKGDAATPAVPAAPAEPSDTPQPPQPQQPQGHV